jgi:hypothetical protein
MEATGSHAFFVQAGRWYWKARTLRAITTRAQMTEPRTNPAYYALRVRPKALLSEWWIAASARKGDAPRPVRALLGGRTRVEVSAEEAVLAIHWAAQLSGWDDHDPHPIFVYPPLATGED